MSYPEVVLSSSFRPITESCSRVPHGTIQNLKNWFLWYLLLEVFTCTSFPVQNPITSVFKVRCLTNTGFLRWLNTLPTYDQNTTKVPLEGGGFKPKFSVKHQTQELTTSQQRQCLLNILANGFSRGVKCLAFSIRKLDLQHFFDAATP
jgi:hypothetical protein